MNISKVVAALNTAATELEALYDATVKQGKTEPQALAGLQALGKTNVLITKAKEKLNVAVEKATPKVKEAKDAKKSDKK